MAKKATKTKKVDDALNDVIDSPTKENKDSEKKGKKGAVDLDKIPPKYHKFYTGS